MMIEESEIGPIEQRIYLIRGIRVMLDRDLAQLYGVPTKALNRAVVRNMVRFPGDFMFQLNAGEAEFLRYQFGTLEMSTGDPNSLRFQPGTLKRGQYSKYLPRVFTEQGVAMLSSVLRGKRAAEVNVAIMRAFVKLRDMRVLYKDLRHQIEELEKRVTGQDTDIKKIFKAMRWLTYVPRAKRGIGFKPSQKA